MAFRIHPYDEHPRTVLDHDRPMGFYADEVGQDHIRGISGCETLADLASWAELYSAKIRDGDFILYINGEDYSIQTYDRGGRSFVSRPVMRLLPGAGSFDKPCLLPPRPGTRTRS